MNRFFLSWDKPACRAVAERLLSLGNDFHRHLVLVPTRESGRQLREYLASISRTQAIFAPQVIPADQFPRMEEKEETASAPEELAGWLLALGKTPHRLYPRLFPRTMPEDFSSMLEMAGSLQNLRHAMANQGVSCIMAHHACAGRDERWKDMEHKELNRHMSIRSTCLISLCTRLYLLSCSFPGAGAVLTLTESLKANI